MDTPERPEVGELAVLRRAMREVLDAGYADCAYNADHACECPTHLYARDVWGKAEALLNGTIDGVSEGGGHA